MTCLASRCLAQNFFIRTSVRIWDVGQISLPPVSECTYVRIGEVRDILALDWCPGVIVFPLQFSLDIFYKQP